MRQTILSVVGTRPNFMKMGPIEDELRAKTSIDHLILHTGQHFDTTMSEAFFTDLELRPPDVNLSIQGGNLGNQTGRIMVAFEEKLLETKPDLVLVYGDVNSTFAAAWVAVQNHIRVAHVESGLRSFDRSMPEEINRICTDVISDLLFTTHPMGDEQLKKEGISEKQIHMVGDIMIDCLVKHQKKAHALATWQNFSLNPKEYGVVTLHRPANVDRRNELSNLVDTLCKIATELPLVFPIHPRTKKNLETFELMHKLEEHANLHTCEPLSYLSFLSLILETRLVLTDSGGLQEETTYLNIPCMTLRENTERPFCINEGTNYLVGRSTERVLETFAAIMAGKQKSAKPMPGWDGKTATRIVKVLDDFLKS